MALAKYVTRSNRTISEMVERTLRLLLESGRAKTPVRLHLAWFPWRPAGGECGRPRGGVPGHGGRLNVQSLRNCTAMWCMMRLRPCSWASTGFTGLAGCKKTLRTQLGLKRAPGLLCCDGQVVFFPNDKVQQTGASGSPLRCFDGFGPAVSPRISYFFRRLAAGPPFLHDPFCLVIHGLRSAVRTWKQGSVRVPGQPESAGSNREAQTTRLRRCAACPGIPVASHRPATATSAA